MLTVVLFTICTSLARSTTSLLDPVISKKGDFTVVGIFDIGSLQTNSSTGEEECAPTPKSIYSIEKATIFQLLIEGFTAPNGSEIGYEIYAGCDSESLTQRIGSKVSLDPSVISVLASDVANKVLSSISSPTAFYIPTISYIYSEEAFLDQDQYPTFLSLLETEEMEAKSLINLLKQLEVNYVDIWYHPLSKSVAEYVYDNYVLKYACGRNIPFDGRNGITEEFDEYLKSEVPLAPVQMLLFNGNIKHVMPFLNKTVIELGWRNMTYILGYTVSRDRYREDQMKLLEGVEGLEEETFIYLRSEIQNADLSELREKGGALYNKAASPDDPLAHYMRTSRGCTYTPSTDTLSCSNTRELSSWVNHVAAATELIKASIAGVMGQQWGFGDVFSLRKALYQDMVTSSRDYSFYGNEIGNVEFYNRTVSNGYEVLVMKDGAVFSAGSVTFHPDQATRLSGVLQPWGQDGYHVTTLSHPRVSAPCSAPCTPGSHSVLTDPTTPGLSCCWSCHECPHDTVSLPTDPLRCDQCADNQTAISNTCTAVEVRFIGATGANTTPFWVACGLACVSVVTIGMTLRFIAVYQDRPVIKASDHVFCYLFLSSLILGDVTTVVSLLQPSPWSCYLELYVCSIFVSLSSVHLLFRSLKIYRIFTAAQNFEIHRPLIFKLFTRTSQAVIVVVSVVVSCVLSYLCIRYEGWQYQDLLPAPHGPIYLLCTSHHFLASCLPFILPCLYFLATLQLAFKMRLFPHNFKETTSIFTSSLVVFTTCLMFLTGYSIAEPSIRAGLRAIVYFTITHAFLGCLFGPKVLVVVNKEDLNPELQIMSTCSTGHSK